MPVFGSFVPLIRDGSCRQVPLDLEVAAVPLAKLFDQKTGRLKFATREALCERFKIARHSRLVIDSVGFDQPLEHYWGAGRGAGLPVMLAALKPDLVTVPNFSLFTDLPRPEDLRNMKRIVICWEELACLGLTTALHLNGRTDQDWARWLRFLQDHPEITAVAFEFTSGTASPERAVWYARHLIRVSENIQRELTLIVRGARIFLSHFAQSFKQVVYVSADPFIKTVKGRKSLRWDGTSRPKWTVNHTSPGEPLDSLLAQNIQTMSQLIAHQMSQPPDQAVFKRGAGLNGNGDDANARSRRVELSQISRVNERTLFDGLDKREDSSRK
jgi:hypothetical protein